MQVRAKVALMLEIDVRSSWNSDAVLTQVHKQASEEAIGTILDMIKEYNQKHNPYKIKIVGAAQVSAIIASKS